VTWTYLKKTASKSTGDQLRGTRNALKYTWDTGGARIQAGWTQGFNAHQCSHRPRAGFCGSQKAEFYARNPVRVYLQQYYYDSVDKKGYWYHFRLDGRGTTYDAWKRALDAATNSSNVRWRNNGKASRETQVQAFDEAYALSRPVLVRMIAQMNQTTRTTRREEIARQTPKTTEDQGPEAAPVNIPWLAMAALGGGAYYLWMRG